MHCNFKCLSKITGCHLALLSCRNKEWLILLNFFLLFDKIGYSFWSHYPCLSVIGFSHIPMIKCLYTHSCTPICSTLKNKGSWLALMVQWKITSMEYFHYTQGLLWLLITQNGSSLASLFFLIRHTMKVKCKCNFMLTLKKWLQVLEE